MGVKFANGNDMKYPGKFLYRLAFPRQREVALMEKNYERKRQNISKQM